MADEHILSDPLTDEDVQEIGEALADLLGDICQRTGDVLKGPPAPLRQHSWHDLPEVAADLIAQRDRFAADLRRYWEFYHSCPCGGRQSRFTEGSDKPAGPCVWVSDHAPGCATAEAIEMEGRDG